MLRQHFLMFARYNQWANARLYAAVARLPEAHYFEDRGAFFKSLHGTLSHVLVADRMWMSRFTGTANPHSRLDEQPYADLPALDRARVAEDARIVEYISSLGEDRLSEVIEYRRASTPETIRQVLSPMLAHFFNHQAHHRGQAHTLLTALGGEGPELDLIFYQRQAPTLAT